MASYTLSPVSPWLQSKAHALLRRAVFAWLDAHVGRRFDRVVDLACADGTWTREYARRAREAVGIDVNETFLEEARTQSAASPSAERPRFARCDIVDYNDYERVELVAMGACLMYVSDEGIETVLSRIEAQGAHARWVYVRASTRTPFAPRVHEPGAYYRDASWYEATFRRFGYVQLERAHSAELAVGHLTRSAVAAKVLTAPSRVARIVRRENDFVNWLFRTG